jgi:glutamate/tyrosine decarboxylase-like PLP-dependent enzyme
MKPAYVAVCVSVQSRLNNDLKKLGKIAETEQIWFHIDLAIAVSFTMLSELQHGWSGSKSVLQGK